MLKRRTKEAERRSRADKESDAVQATPTRKEKGQKALK